MGVSDTKIFCIKFDSDDKYIAAACENGEIRVYNTRNE
jgi:WD40 repeat protein